MSINSDLISIIIPAFNASSRIKFALESIINQDYDNLEIIFVNDASSDGTELIANKTLSHSKRVFRIINHPHNMGVCSARNTGINASIGKYICFVDADDMLKPDYVSCLHEIIARDDCDIAFCGVTERFMNKNKPDKNFHAAFIKSCISSGYKFILDDIIPSVWCCMYKSDLLVKYKLLFLEGCSSGEDIDFIKRALCAADRVTFTPEFLYIYMHHDEMGSVRDNNKILRYEHNTLAQENTAEFFINHAGSEKLRDLAEKILIPNNMIRKLNIYALNNDKSGYYSFLDKKIIRRVINFYAFINKPELFFKALMIIYAPGFYFILRRLYGL